MPRPKNSQCHHEEVEHFGVAVQLKQLTPDGNLYVEHRHFDERFRKSLRTKDLEKARAWARDHCKEIALQKEGGALGAAVRSNKLTLGELFDAFRERGMPRYEKEVTRTHLNRLSMSMRLMEHVWGRSLRLEHLDQQRIDEFVTRREERGIRLDEKTFEPVSRRTSRADLDCLSAILKWAQKQRHEGDWLLPGVNPLARVDLPPEKPDSEISRPIADQERYEAVLEFADQIGDTERHKGRYMLPALLQVARHTGRRLQAILNLRWEDICLDREACEATLRRDQAPVRRAREWPHGAIRWRAEHNKMGYGSVIPIRRELQEALKRYRVRGWPALLEKIAGEKWDEKFDPEDMLLFPSPSDPRNLVHRSTPRDWLVLAEDLARQANRRGAPSVDEKQGGFHAYRRWWASERSHYTSDMGKKAVRIAGGWKPKGDTMRRVYLQVPADQLYKVVANEKSDGHQAGVVSLEVLRSLVADVVDQLSTGSARESIERFPDLSERDQKRLLWELIRAAEQDRSSLSSSEIHAGSQDVVKSVEKVG